MTLPIIDNASITDLAEIASVEGDMRNQSQEQAIDMTVIFEHLRKKMSFKTGEKVFDEEDDEMSEDE